MFFLSFIILFVRNSMIFRLLCVFTSCSLKYFSMLPFFSSLIKCCDPSDFLCLFFHSRWTVCSFSLLYPFFLSYRCAVPKTKSIDRMCLCASLRWNTWNIRSSFFGYIFYEQYSNNEVSGKAKKGIEVDSSFFSFILRVLTIAIIRCSSKM